VLAPGIALALLVFAAAVPSTAPLPAKMRGVCWEAGRRIGGEALDPLKAVGVDWISETPFGWSASPHDPDVALSGGAFQGYWGMWGESDDGLAETARLARARGIKTLLKPHVWVRSGEWVGETEMKTEEDWRRWFAAYEAFILHYAALAEREGMDGLAIGTELPKTSKRTADWRRIVARVRETYHGPLTYCANWHEAEDVGFWDALDFVGVQAYYPLVASEHPKPEEIRAAWVPIVARLGALAKRTGRRIVFTEVGYRSLAGCLSEPWKWGAEGTVDLDLQRDAYREMFGCLWDQPWFGGTFVWKWQPWLGSAGPAVGRALGDFTPQGKPALDAIRDRYTRP
jgi:hypothetical protein